MRKYSAKPFYSCVGKKRKNAASFRRIRIGNKYISHGQSRIEDDETFEISANTLRMFDLSIKNMMEGYVSEPIDIGDIES